MKSVIFLLNSLLFNTVNSFNVSIESLFIVFSSLLNMMAFVFFKLRFKSHCLHYFSKISSFSCNPFLVRKNIAKSTAKSKEFISVLNKSGDSLSSDCVSCFSNYIGRSFINKLKNIVLKISPCLSSIDLLNGVEA